MGTRPEQSDEKRFVSRGGLKLDHALTAFGVDVAGAVCVDLGCSTGGFTDCLLQRGAARVTSIDTAYGIIDYRLRTDDRVTVIERTNAWNERPRRMNRDHDRNLAVSTAWIWLTEGRMLLRRLTTTPPESKP